MCKTNEENAMNHEQAKDDLLSTGYEQFRAYLSNDESKLKSANVDECELFDVPVLKAVLNHLEGGVISNPQALANELESIMDNIADEMASEVVEKNIEF